MNNQRASLLTSRTALRDPMAVATWSPVVSHTHLLRANLTPPAEVPLVINAWTRAHGVRAMGVGSPWEAESAAAYIACEGEDRDRYDAELMPREDTMCESAVHGIVDDLNRRGQDACHYYLDNETPKARYGHLWYFGWKYLWPAWHDYSQGRHVWFNEGDIEAEINPLTGQPHRRRAYLEVIHEQRRHGALAVWAHPTSWWRNDTEFVTNIAAELPLHLHCDGYLDGLAVMGYDACHRNYQALWFHLLDTGAIVPGFAETDHCFDDGKRTHTELLLATRMPIGDRPGTERIMASARRGLAFASSGPHLTLTVDGVEMGSRTATAAGQQHRVRVEVWPSPGEACLSRIELVGRGGTILGSVESFRGGILEWGIEGADQAGWVLARAWGEHDDAAASNQQSIRSFAITNPVYLTHGVPFAAVRSAYRLGIRDDSPWAGGQVRFTNPDGLVLYEAEARAGSTLSVELPGNARVELACHGRRHAFFIASEDRPVQALLRHLYAGEFLAGRPDLVPGTVPPESFALNAMRQALSSASHQV